MNDYIIELLILYLELLANIDDEIMRIELNILIMTNNDYLVGGFNPLEKYACQIESFPQVRVTIK